MTGLSIAPAKVIVIGMPNISEAKNAGGETKSVLPGVCKNAEPIPGGIVGTVEELKTRVKEAVAEALITLAQAGVLESGKGRFSSGQALDWSRLNFEMRQKEMCRVLNRPTHLLQRKNCPPTTMAISLAFFP
jgi:hypothetical protein